MWENTGIRVGISAESDEKVVDVEKSFCGKRAVAGKFVNLREEISIRDD